MQTTIHAFNSISEMRGTRHRELTDYYEALTRRNVRLEQLTVKYFNIENSEVELILIDANNKNADNNSTTSSDLVALIKKELFLTNEELFRGIKEGDIVWVEGRYHFFPHDEIFLVDQIGKYD